MTKLEFVSYDKGSRQHGWKCEACQEYHWCEDEMCENCNELSPYLEDHCPGCHDEYKTNEYMARTYR